MKIYSISFKRVAFPFKEEFVYSKSSMKGREIILIRIESLKGRVGYGEASPLPSHGTEDFDMVEEALRGFRNRYCGKVIDNFYDFLPILYDELIETPSAAFAIEQALLPLFSKTTIPNIRYLFPNDIRVNALVGYQNYSELPERIREISSSGFECVKIKIGRNNFPDLKSILDEIATFSPNLRIRLDANSSLSYQEAEELIDVISGSNIDYIEQPLAGIEEMNSLALQRKVDIAIDEDIKTYEQAKEVIENTAIQVLVIKPSLFGGITKTINVIDLARNFDKKIVISSAFESSVGREAVLLIAAYAQNDTYHGLDTAKYFAEDFISDYGIPINGIIKFPERKIDKSLLLEKHFC